MFDNSAGFFLAKLATYL